MPVTPELQATIDDAYRLFAPYLIGSTLIVCNCNVCMTKEVERELIRMPLRKIPSELLAEYTNSAHSWDDDQVAREMRYFLPRYLELIALGDPPDNLGLDICLRRLRYAQWRTKWAAAEVALLDTFFDRLVEASIQRLAVIAWPRGPALAFDMADLLTLVISAEGDLGRVLAVWDRAPDPGAAIHMASLRPGIIHERGRTYFWSAHLEEHPAAADQIGEFLMRPCVAERIDASFFLTDDAQLQRILSDAV
jgi:hypothetical protein